MKDGGYDGEHRHLIVSLFAARRYSFEFRHPSWYAPRILRMLRCSG
jgi:hypothetical protein